MLAFHPQVGSDAGICQRPQSQKLQVSLREYQAEQGMMTLHVVKLLEAA